MDFLVLCEDCNLCEQNFKTFLWICRVQVDGGANVVNVRSVLSERGTVPTLAARSVAQVSILCHTFSSAFEVSLLFQVRVTDLCGKV